MAKVISPPAWDRLEISKRFMIHDLERSGLTPDDISVRPYALDTSAGGFVSQTIHIPAYDILWFDRQGAQIKEMYRRRLYTVQDRNRFAFDSEVGVAKEKYTQPPISQIGVYARYPYFPTGRLSLPKGNDYFIVEGEKKAAKLFKEHPSWMVGIGGDWMWTEGAGSKSLHPEIRADIIDAEPTRLIILADGDWTKYQINMAYAAAFSALKDEFPDLPIFLADLSNTGEKGIDDFLVAGGKFEELPLMPEDQIDRIEPPQSLVRQYNLIPRIKTVQGAQVFELIGNEDTCEKLMRGHPAFREEHLWMDMIKGYPIWRGERFEKNNHDVEILAYFQRYFSLPMLSLQRIQAVISRVYSSRKRWPLREWVENIPWDGERRLETFFPRYAGVKDNDYTRAVSKNFLLGAIKRLFHPGIKHDMMVIFSGSQSLTKTTFWEVLFGHDNVNAIYGTFANDRDFRMNINRRWCACIEEMHTFAQYDSEHLKAMITATDDVYRAPYAAMDESHLRWSVFVGNTNEPVFLKEEQNRRFCPMTITKLDVKALRRDRDQIWAEAYARGILDNEQHWLEDDLQFEDMKHEFIIQDESYDDYLREVIEKMQIMHRHDGAPILRPCDVREALMLRTDNRKINSIKLGKAMRNLGWDSAVVRGTSMEPPIEEGNNKALFWHGPNRVWKRDMKVYEASQAQSKGQSGRKAGPKARRSIEQES